MVEMRGKLVKRMVVMVCAVALMSVAAPAAWAQSSSQRGYNGEAPLGQVGDIAPGQQVSGEEAPVAGQVVSGAAGEEAEGALPFTGRDLGIVLVLGLALAGTGLVVRRAARSSGD